MSSNASAPSVSVMGHQRPSVEHLPAVIETTALADECVEFVNEVGIDLDPWQEHCLRMSLSEADSELWSAFLIGVVVARQNGKGTLLEAREIAGLFHIGESLILHSAHEFKTCYEHFLRIVQVIESCPDIDRQVQKIRRGVGEQAVELRNGNRLRFIARSSGSGRGMSAPCVVLDEAMFLTEAQIGAIMPTLSAQPNPQLWFTSSAPLASSEALHRLRRSAIDGTGERLYYAEWGNDASADPTDPEAIARANPALGRRLFLDFVQTEREAMSPEEFARERLGVPEVVSASAGPIDTDRWAELLDGESMPADTEHGVRLALDAPPGCATAVFAMAGRRADGLTHVSVRRNVPKVEREKPDQSVRDRVVDFAAVLAEHHHTPILIAAKSPALAWRADLEAAGVPVEVMPTEEYAQACGSLISAISDGSLRHRGQPELDTAIAGLATRSSGDVDVWSRRSSKVDIAPCVAVTCALARVPEKVAVTVDPWVMIR